MSTAHNQKVVRPAEIAVLPGRRLPVRTVLRLQQTIGNRAVVQLLTRVADQRSSTPARVSTGWLGRWMPSWLRRRINRPSG